MRFTTIIASALTAAAVIAAPLEKRAITTTWVVEVVTETTTVYGTPTPTPSPPAALQQGGEPQHTSKAVPPPAPSTSSEPPAPTSSTPPAQVSPPQPVAPTPAKTPPSPPAAGACGAYNPNPDFNTPPVSCGVSVLDTVNKWRRAYGKPELAWASNLAQAAWATLTYNGGGGKGMDHPGLIDGSYGETITPGYWDTATLSSEQRTNTLGESPFEIALMGWLCEVKSDPQLQASGFTGKDQCNIVHGVSYISGSKDPSEPTGHHDIFVSDTYKTIGCEYMQSTTGSSEAQWSGQWTCDFGF